MTLLHLFAASCLACLPPEFGSEPTAAKPVVTLVNPAAGDQDDLCVWRHPSDPSASRLIVSDKKNDMVFVNDLAGSLVQTVDVPKPGNIDIRQRVDLGGKTLDIVVVNEREPNPALWVFSVGTDGALSRIDGGVPTGPNYGGGLFHDRKDGKLYFISTSEPGPTEQYELYADGEKVLGRKVRTIPTESQCEGAAADDATGRLYIAEEAVGLWVLPADPNEPGERELILKVGENGVEGDLEGVAIVPTGETSGYVLVSDQGRSRVVVLDRATHAVVGTFAVAGAHDTDGIEAVRGDFGPTLPGGLFACHTDRTDLTPHKGKPILVTPWAEIEKAIKAGKRE